jgi:metal-responsive CopG/Arc/MetJ family transcriptional regulator
MKDNSKKMRTAIYFKQEIIDEIEKESLRTGIKRADLIRIALRLFLSRKKEKQKTENCFINKGLEKGF